MIPTHSRASRGGAVVRLDIVRAFEEERFVETFQLVSKRSSSRVLAPSSSTTTTDSTGLLPVMSHVLIGRPFDGSVGASTRYDRCAEDPTHVRQECPSRKWLLHERDVGFQDSMPDDCVVGVPRHI